MTGAPSRTGIWVVAALVSAPRRASPMDSTPRSAETLTQYVMDQKSGLTKWP